MILAELNAEDPREVARQARQAATRQWMQFASKAHGRASAQIHEGRWQEQIGDVIEFYTAWVPATVSYQDDRKTVARLLAGRKNCRDFLAAVGHEGVPESSLDERESVLKDADRRVRSVYCALLLASNSMSWA